MITALLYEIAFWTLMCVAVGENSPEGRHFPPLREIRAMPDSTHYDYREHRWQKRGSNLMYHADDCYNEEHYNPYEAEEVEPEKDTVIEINGMKINNGLNIY
jgi:hypothetical protein